MKYLHEELKVLEKKRQQLHSKMLETQCPMEFDKTQSNYWAVLVKIGRINQLLKISPHQTRTIASGIYEYSTPSNYLNKPSNYQ